MQSPLPLGQGGNSGTMGAHLVPVDFAPTRVDIDLVDADATLALPDVADGPEEENNGHREPRREELVGGRDLIVVAGWEEGADELGGGNVRVFFAWKRGRIVADGNWGGRLTVARSTIPQRISPTQDPATPKTAWKGISSRVWPCRAQAWRNRMCARQMEPQVKRAARPESERNHCV